MRMAPRHRWFIQLLMLAACVGCGGDTPSTDDCNTDSDCAHLDDGDPCNGAVACGSFQQCVANQAPVVCDNNPCAQSQCNPETGACDVEPKADGAVCIPESPCFSDGLCTNGECQGKNPTCLEDDNPCTTVVCQPASGQCTTQVHPNFELCDDGNACTENDRCLEGTCSGAPLECPTGDNPCAVPTCDPLDGQCDPVAVPDGDGCDDDNPCTTSDGCMQGVCVGGASACAHLEGPCVSVACQTDTGECTSTPTNESGACDDGSLCSTDDACLEGVCTGTAAPCPETDGPCNEFICLPATGECILQPTTTFGPCDDNDLCTANDACLNGDCAGDPVACPDDGNPCTTEGCAADKGCLSVPLEDGAGCNDNNPCSLTSVCTNGKCVIDTPTCPAPDNSCMVVACDPGDGSCVYEPLPEGAACEDGDACTENDLCADFLCTSGAPVTCEDDGNGCTQETCDPSTGCNSELLPDGAVCEDDNACTENAACADNTCQGGTAVTCTETPGQCEVIVCDPSDGCSIAPADDGSPCSDDDECTENDSCSSGSCAGTAVVCADTGDPCLTSTCDPTVGCLTEMVTNATACDDANACTAETTCQQGACVAASQTVCPPSTISCRVNLCDPKSGSCVLLPDENGTACDDTDPCTEGTVCGEGVCIGGLIPPCPSDGDACTSDICIPTAGCLYPQLSNGAPCDDGSACTDEDRCTSGQCAGTEAVSCPPPNNPCFLSACDDITGNCAFIPAPTGTPCNDNNVCTTGDACDEGLCGGSTVECSQDQNPCTVAVCPPATGLCATQDSPVGTPCDDDNLCTDNDVCGEEGVCDGQGVVCPTPNGACQQAICDGSTGSCVQGDSPDGSACSDTDPCTVDDYCVAGSCTAGTTPACVASQPCVDSTCVPETGDCTETPLANGIPCNDNDACTAQGQCINGACLADPPPPCDDDGNPCTLDVCDPATGLCGHPEAPFNTSCDDGDACTIGDHCEDALCVAASTVDCPSENGGCQVGTCIPLSGGCTWIEAADSAPCEDNDLCTDNDSCAQGHCVGQTVNCPPSETVCQTATCQPATGCTTVAVQDGKPCGEVPCLAESTCSGGTCSGGNPLPCPAPTNPCNVAFCDPNQGCSEQPAADGTVCNDDNPCTTSDQCQSGACTGVALSCPDEGPCLVGTCTASTGCTTVPASDGVACDDGSPCTGPDTCTSGVCEAGTPTDCTAGSPCQPESCDENTGLCTPSVLADGEPCDDNNPCSAVSICVDGLCQVESLIACPQPTEACWLSACLPETGQCETFQAPDDMACDDDSLCTGPDRCLDGTCVGMATVLCPNPNGCIRSTCDPDTGTCQPQLADEQAPCDSETTCSVGAQCSLGTCQDPMANPTCCTSASDCDDGTPCTIDSCSAGRCQYARAPLPACIGRVLVLGADDDELHILDANTLLPVPGSPITLDGMLRQVAISETTQQAWIAAENSANIQLIDPFSPSAYLPGPTAATGPTRWIAIDDQRGIAVVMQDTGTIRSYDLETTQLLVDGVTLPTHAGLPALATATGWLYTPTPTGHLNVLDVMAPHTALPSTPWTIGGQLSAIALEPHTATLYLADAASNDIRVISAQDGAGLNDDPLDGPSTVGDLAIDTVHHRLLVSYPDVSILRSLDLNNPTVASAITVAISGEPQVLHQDNAARRTYALGAQANVLHVRSSDTLAAVPQSPVPVPQGAVDVATAWTRPGAVVITEVLVNNIDDQWIELYNPGSDDLDIADWTIETGVATYPLSTTVPLTIATNTSIVICNGDTSPNLPCDATIPGLIFGPAPHTITVRDGALTIIDHARVPDMSGDQSRALIHPGYHNGRMTHWTVAVPSPGQAN